MDEPRVVVAQAYDPRLQEAETGRFPQIQAARHGLHFKCQINLAYIAKH